MAHGVCHLLESTKVHLSLRGLAVHTLRAGERARPAEERECGGAERLALARERPVVEAPPVGVHPARPACCRRDRARAHTHTLIQTPAAGAGAGRAGRGRGCR